MFLDTPKKQLGPRSSFNPEAYKPIDAPSPNHEDVAVALGVVVDKIVEHIETLPPTLRRTANEVLRRARTERTLDGVLRDARAVLAYIISPAESSPTVPPADPTWVGQRVEDLETTLDRTKKRGAPTDAIIVQSEIDAWQHGVVLPIPTGPQPPLLAPATINACQNFQR